MNSFKNSSCVRLFAWVAKAKFTMCLFFSVYVIVFLLLGLLTKGTTITLGFFTALEMMAACFLIGMLQQLILPVNMHSRVRGALWVISGTLITLLFALIFQWFKAFLAWCFPAFIVVIFIGMFVVILINHLELLNETKQLNRKLVQFQNNHESNEDSL